MRDYDYDEDYDEADRPGERLYCPNLKCGASWFAATLHEEDTNFHGLRNDDDAYCPECGAEGRDTAPCEEYEECAAVCEVTG